MAGDFHADDLRNSSAAHVADGGAAKMVEFEFGNTSFFASLNPNPSEALDGLAIAMEDSCAAVRFIEGPLQPRSQRVVQNRHSARVAALRLGGLQRDEGLIPIDLVPVPRK